MGHKNYFSCFLLLLQLTSCESQSSSSYVVSTPSSNYSIIDKYGLNKIDWPEIFNQSGEEYFAYVYSETCSYCNKIKPMVSYFCSTIANPFYFIEFSDEIPINTDHKKTIGIKNVENLYIRGTPTLFFIKNKEIFDCFCGYSEIFEYISSYKYEFSLNKLDECCIILLCNI